LKSGKFNIFYVIYCVFDIDMHVLLGCGCWNKITNK